MASDSTLLLGGDVVSIPMTEKKERMDNQISTPEWMISIDDMLTSTIKGYEKYSELYGWHAEHSRETKGNVSGDLVSNASVKQSDVIIIVKMGLYIPKLDNMMVNGKVLDMITIIRLGNYEDKKLPIQTINFNACQISKIEQRLDKAVITFRPVKRTNTITQYDQVEGKKLGQTVSEFDFSKGE